MDWIVLTFATSLGIAIAALASWSAREDNLVRSRAERTLRSSEEKYRMILDGIQGYAIFMLDPHGRVVSWNAGAEHLKGYKASEIIGPTLFLLLSLRRRYQAGEIGGNV